MKWYARIKYSRQAIPFEYEFATEAEAKTFARYKAQNNPYVRWTAVDQVRKFSNQPVESI